MATAGNLAGWSQDSGTAPENPSACRGDACVARVPNNDVVLEECPSTRFSQPPIQDMAQSDRQVCA